MPIEALRCPVGGAVVDPGRSAGRLSHGTIVTEEDPSKVENIRADVRQMARAFLASPRRNGLFALAGGIVAVIGVTAYMQIRLNAWSQPFYDALTRKDMAGFLRQLLVFAVIAGILLALNVTQRWLNQRTRLELRRGLVEDLFAEWLAPLRAFRLSNAGAIGTNPDQRMAADAQHLTDLTTDLGVGLLQAGLLLFSFIGVLWRLSDGMSVTIGSFVFAPPGYMVWCALLYAGGASLASWAVGRPLVRLNADHYAREADFRFELVRASESIEAITIYGGERPARARLLETFGTIYVVLRRIVGAVTRLTWVTAGYGWFTLVAPILVAAPTYFSGQMSFGELMMIVGAFNQVQSSLRWFVDNFAAVADWQATLMRVAGFRRAVIEMDDLGAEAGRIVITETAGPELVFAGLKVAGPAGSVSLTEERIALRPGERILIEGAHGEGKTLLFRALSGLWPWGEGAITRPAKDRVLFLPSRPYVPSGSLRDCVAYPYPGSSIEDARIAAALADVGLGRLAGDLDTVHRWDRHLSENEKHCLSFARVILHRPDWVVIDDALNLVARSTRRQIETIFMERLTSTGVVTIGHDGGQPGFYTRTVGLRRDPQGLVFDPESYDV
ncbi:MAG: ABC transporter ATP-binding protein/permease [Paenirhodobacter sp.]